MEKPSSKQWLNIVIRILGLLVMVGALVFVSAGTLRWWPGWVFFIGYSFLVTAFVIYSFLFDPALFKERTHKAANVKKWDTVILNIYTPCLVATVVLAALDGGRFHWSYVPLWVQLAGAGMQVLCSVLLFRVVKANTFLSSHVRIQADRGHTVITTGPYRFVRHPMYAANLLFFPSIPFLLGSWWALIPAELLIGLFILRTALEDRTLMNELPGYREYAERTRYRMIPCVW